jgi:hypothetical protein
MFFIGRDSPALLVRAQCHSLWTLFYFYKSKGEHQPEGTPTTVKEYTYGLDSNFLYTKIKSKIISPPKENPIRKSANKGYIWRIFNSIPATRQKFNAKNNIFLFIIF